MGKAAIRAASALPCRRAARLAVLLLGVSSLGACNNPSANATASRPYQSPDQYAGGTRGGGRQSPPSYEWMQEQEQLIADKKVSDAETARVRALEQAEALWCRAEGRRSPDDAADDYKKIADDHKDSPRAEEARWREAQKRMEDGDWNAAVVALDAYTRDYPITPHLREAERMLYESSLNVFAGARGGLRGIFKSDKKGYDGLNAIVERFPQGEYPDDALMALGAQYASKDEWADAALQYHSLLLRYPDSDLAYDARLRLGDAYLARDQGVEYHPGYVDVDPRVPKASQTAATRHVKSCVEAALESYDDYLEKIAKDPAARARSADGIAYAQQRQADCRERLAAKSRAIAAYYSRCGQGDAAETYQHFAENEAAGRPWCENLGTCLPNPATSSAAPTVATGSPSQTPADAAPPMTSMPPRTSYAPPPAGRPAVGPTPSSPPSTYPSSSTPSRMPTPTVMPPTTGRPTSTVAPQTPPTYAPPSSSPPYSSSPYSSPSSIPSPSTRPSSTPIPAPTTSTAPPATSSGTATESSTGAATLPPGVLPPPRRTSRDGSTPR